MKPIPEIPLQFSKVFNEFEQDAMHLGCSLDYWRGVNRNVRNLLQSLDEKGVKSTEELSIEQIMSYINETLSHLSAPTMRSTVGHLRKFLKFCYLNQFTTLNIGKMIPSVRNYSLAKVPTVWEKDSLQKTLESIDRTTSIGKRDYAIMLLAATLGLRISDILNLEFSSVDWEKQQIHIVQQKTGELLSLTLSDDVAWAVIANLKNGRPKSELPYLFLRHCAPYQKFCANTNFHHQIRKYAKLADVSLPSDTFYGIHSFRSTFASNLLKEGASLQEISQLLGHRGYSATAKYLKVDEDKLMLCALNPDIEVNDEK